MPQISPPPNAAPIPSGSCALLRADEASGRGLSVLLVKKSPKLRAYAGAWVFPGGRIDEEDARCADPRARARVATAREVLEETQLALAPEALVVDAHWTSPLNNRFRFSSWIFWAEAPRGSASPDGQEIVELAWFTPQAALSAHRAHQIELPPPVFVTLCKLSKYKQLSAALESRLAEPPLHITPKPIAIGGGFISLYPGDAGYLTEDPALPGARHRLVMLSRDWRYEGSG